DVDLLHGQKTGFYLDQLHNYKIVAQYATDRRVLDCFTNQGAFALVCARAGAAAVTGVEENSLNLAAAKRNAALNQLNLNWIEQDPDHPVLPTWPETEYFKGYLFEMIPGR